MSLVHKNGGYWCHLEHQIRAVCQGGLFELISERWEGAAHWKGGAKSVSAEA